MPGHACDDTIIIRFYTIKKYDLSEIELTKYIEIELTKECPLIKKKHDLSEIDMKSKKFCKWKFGTDLWGLKLYITIF